MKILFLTNFFPPASRGGYEQWCQEVADGLRDRGHRVEILTSRYISNRCNIIDPPWVHRTLYLEMEINSLWNGLVFFTIRRQHEDANLQELQRRIRICEPEAILVWGMWNLSRRIPALVEQLRPGKVAYYFGDYWFFLPSQIETYWKLPGRSWKTSLPKIILKPFALRLLAREKKPNLLIENAIFPSKFLRDEYLSKGIILKNVSVIYGAADTRHFRSTDKRFNTSNGNTTLLYVGRLIPEKGVDTCIQALTILEQIQSGSVNLLIVGSGERDYENYLRSLAQEKQVEDRVVFLGPQTKSELPNIYRSADIFLFPSIWAEPFGRVLVEAMAARLPVIGTGVGGAAEILRDGENALLFKPGDPEAMAAQISRLIQSPDLRQRLINAGRRTAEKFDIQRMIGEIEMYLQALVDQ